MANLLERMGLVRTEYGGLPNTQAVPVPEIPYATEAFFPII